MRNEGSGESAVSTRYMDGFYSKIVQNLGPSDIVYNLLIKGLGWRECQG